MRPSAVSHPPRFSIDRFRPVLTAGLVVAGVTLPPRAPPGHPEGYLESFANIYQEAAHAIIAAREGRKPAAAVTYPTIEDGVKGVAFIEACIKSSAKNAAWTKL